MDTNASTTTKTTKTTKNQDENTSTNRTDVAIIGGGGAGIAAALQLGRIGRRVTLIHSGEPRNAPAAHLHGYPGNDGTPPTEFLATALAQLEPYGVEVVADRVLGVVERPGGQLRVTTAAGRTIEARRLLVATGLTDQLPDLPGIRDRWGDTVIHCPWCHGWEARDGRIAVLDITGLGSHQAMLLSQLSDRVTLVGADVPAGEVRRLELAGVQLEPASAVSVDAVDDHLGVRLDDGRVLDVDTVAIGPGFEPNLAMVADLDLATTDHPSGLGRVLDVCETGRTSHPSVYGAGNVTDPMQQVLHAATDGSTVAGAINADLLEEDLDRAELGGRDSEAWEERYRERPDGYWSTDPNGMIVAELDTPGDGRAIDIGCGEGPDAIWLAEQGWRVTAVDISEVAVERGRAAAASAGVAVEFATRDVLADPPDAASYELMTISYPALGRDRALAGIGPLTDAITPGGELLVIGHADVDRAVAAEHGFDPDDYLSLDDIVAAIGDRFTIDVDEVRDRPNPPPDAHHTRDRVLRARRRTAGRPQGTKTTMPA